MKIPAAAHLQKKLALLELARSNADAARIRWGSADLGTWKSVRPKWQVLGGKIRFRFHGQGGNVVLWISSIRPKPYGVNIELSNPGSPTLGIFEVAWQKGHVPDSCIDSSRLWKIVDSWLKQKHPAHKILQASMRPDRARTLSGLFLRVHFRQRGRDYLLVAADERAGDGTRLAISQALLWLSALAARGYIKPVPAVHILVPSEASAILTHRCRYLNGSRLKAEVWEYEKESTGQPEIRKASDPPPPEENRDFRWPVLGPFRWSSQLERVLNLAPDLIRRYPRFQDYDSLRLWGLEFAQVLGPDRDRICFGVGTLRTDLNESNFDSLRALVEEILFYRRPDSPDIQHPYYRLQAERWLEALILEDVPRLFPELSPESVYSQIPVYLGRDPGRIDVLGADREGVLIVIELKVAADCDLPVQALDYWGRVIQHNKNGDFERRGYFSEVRLNRQRPKIYLVSPVFSFHDSTESLLRYLEPDLEVWKISINEDWRCGVRLMRRIHYRCKDLV
jgi:hypothetical protein